MRTTVHTLSVEMNNRNELIKAYTPIRSTKIFAHAKIFVETKKSKTPGKIPEALLI